MSEYKDAQKEYSMVLREEMKKPHANRDLAKIRALFEKTLSLRETMEQKLVETNIIVGDDPEPFTPDPKIMKNAKPERQKVPTKEIDGKVIKPPKTKGKK